MERFEKKLLQSLASKDKFYVNLWQGNFRITGERFEDIKKFKESLEEILG